MLRDLSFKTGKWLEKEMLKAGEEGIKILENYIKMVCQSHGGGQAWWFMFIIPAIWEAELGGLRFTASPGQNIRPYLKQQSKRKKKKKRLAA
jgi:hypothetical protein